MLTSSNEHVASMNYTRVSPVATSQHERDDTGEDSDDDDENSTALGTGNR